ncbi:MAG: RNA methyltransferase [Rhodothermales bacterium]
MRKLRHEEIPRLDPAETGRSPRHPIAVVIDNVRSAHNVGSFFRTSDGAWIEKLYLTGITATPDHHGLHKTALGAQETVPWHREENTVDAVRRLKSEGYTVAVLELTDSPSLPADLRPEHFPLCLVIGNEVHGVQDDVVAMADLALEIPQYGSKQSLNVSVAYGIAVYDIVRAYRALQGMPAMHERTE